MISVKQAINIVTDNLKPLGKTETKQLGTATNYSLFEDIISPIDMPPFQQSAMDGYAVNLHENLTYTIKDEIKAGDHHLSVLHKGEGVRIFTGAAVPDSANAVIIQEKVKPTEAGIQIDTMPQLNDNIRPMGEQVKKGQVALKAGTNLNTAAIGFLASLGISEVKVNQKPSVAIIVTGNELVQPGQPLPFGKIYESNAIMLDATLTKLGFNDVSIYKIEDNYSATISVLSKALNNHDLIIVSGGISVGDYDFVGRALNELKVNQLFYKVKQKPGKPMFFGKFQETVVFALPGNPAAALSCFYMYVYKALHILSGHNNFQLPKVEAKCQTSFIKKGGRAQFLKAQYDTGNVHILEGQNSSMLHTFALANALVYVPEEKMKIKIDEPVATILLPIN
ncbi:MAG: molybdopterin molybdotransferase MoeA [Bacteroidia bacterium]|nr:molybdopterin molybdotransferase MoeA [Bacteroidia bacterium]NND51772.1 molybdopterin molybdotransferase MoeA [Flavobacteriaceae bacterium]